MQDPSRGSFKSLKAERSEDPAGKPTDGGNAGAEARKSLLILASQRRLHPDFKRQPVLIRVHLCPINLCDLRASSERRERV
jgi:hypothetical protein